MEITGRLTADAIIATTSKGNQLVKFNIATNHRYKSKEGENKEVVTFFSCSYWLSTNIAKYLLRGGLVEVSGRVSASAYLDSKGEPKAGLNFHVNSLVLHGGHKKNEESKVVSSIQEPAPPAAPEDDLPF